VRRSRLTRIALWTLAALLVVPNAWAGEIGQVRVTEAELLADAG
jgi:hypothetical protein